MKNTNTTKKYILALQALALIAVFLIAKPILTFAQDATDDGNVEYSSDDSGSVEYSSDDYDTPVEYSSDDNAVEYSSDDNTPVEYSSDDNTPLEYSSDGSASVQYNNIPTATYISSGGYYGGSTSYVPSDYYGDDSVVTTGGFSGGTETIVPPVTYVSNPIVTSGGYYGGGTTYYNNEGLTGSCYASQNNDSVGSSVTWGASATGGDGVYNYSWTGSEGLSGTGQSVTMSYPDGGEKTATVFITSGTGQSISETCSTNAGPNIVSNQVLAYANTATPLSEVSLTQVPQTGAGDIVRVISFILALVAWSALLAYFFIKRKYGVNIFAPVLAKSETQNTEASVANTFAGKVASDAQEISFVEDYARMKKVILSSDAAIKLVKMQKLGKGSAISAIDTLSGNEWTAVGENDLEK